AGANSDALALGGGVSDSFGVLFLTASDLADPSVVSTTGDSSSAISFDALDMSAVQSFYTDPDWTGVAFGEDIGIWFHPSFTAGSIIGDAGGIEAYEIVSQSWYDTANRTTDVPEPAPLALIAFASAGLIALRRRQRKAA
ncbi:MAG: PEP-CTERM sorting domain-containing protein, partial [Pseudomonadota bacterium]